MGPNQFYQYMQSFEASIVITGVSQGLLGTPSSIPIREGKLARKHFGKIINKVPLLTERSIVIDYYGLHKKSVGFTKIANSNNGNLTNCPTTLVYFAAIKIKDIATLAPGLAGAFPLFKERILVERGFKKHVHHDTFK